MSVIGDHYEFDLELTDETGKRAGCRWHVDASSLEIAVSLRALADSLDPA